MFIPKPKQKFIAIHRRFKTKPRIGVVTCKMVKHYKIEAVDDEGDKWTYPFEDWRFEPQDGHRKL